MLIEYQMRESLEDFGTKTLGLTGLVFGPIFELYFTAIEDKPISIQEYGRRCSKTYRISLDLFLGRI